MERFVIIVNDLQPLTIITKRSILDVPTALDPLLGLFYKKAFLNFCKTHRKTPVSKSLFSGLRPATLLKKETLAHIFSCEFCTIFKNTCRTLFTGSFEAIPIETPTRQLEPWPLRKIFDFVLKKPLVPHQGWVIRSWLYLLYRTHSGDCFQLFRSQSLQ